ncbi:esterase-like activity of phytase family protein [Pseudoalteromonas luteoviolacea]|uniref:Phytase-like domain-containing protein n=1 Tax=Pseudoalteromonas luteoviolacea S4054 TaxID=1129367 RepID=A0A0F6AC29_9GAMM|nr:esterase-like activity of phytase family protein [Pseudoalteromonas luteoviolacea]AOT10620.1 hypothetical protein S4054249_22430 [Pseudoalteromonas luteoviolacea]AOT15312.1 hypothetical protein S40542_21165 [Pseudoalteromonas luteoviolacea]AOT20439.1 hypothetical protein S4054_22345 [Pseudoalteromonas luteoviolacea]KKE83718.1 hypothetical protein N479_12895 [Pseudoalteromonas luteoviolacea S4054]KZN71922.1 hypothetical protein N481_17260 [Pseudoalteromonas luteoviolacea S4047-1]
MRNYLFFALLAPFFAHSATMQLSYLDEFIVPADLKIKGDTVGGLSSIEFANGKYLMIADDADNPRYFSATIQINENKFTDVKFEQSIQLISKNERSIVADPESLRALPNNSGIAWSSEGSIKYNKSPAIFLQTESGMSRFELPSMFDINKVSGPRHNAVFEGLTISPSGKGMWVSMEGPLKQDGEKASIKHGSMIRISYFDFVSKKMQKQFAYFLEPMVNRPEAKPDAFRTTGLVEILQINEHQFLTMERSYTAGIPDGGNSVSIFLIDIKNATDTSQLASLKSDPYQAAKKTLVLNMESIKHQLGSKHIDNLEGMTFGPRLSNGNQSLLMVSDNNFNIHGKQLSQILLFEVKNKK